MVPFIRDYGPYTNLETTLDLTKRSLGRLHDDSLPQHWLKAIAAGVTQLRRLTSLQKGVSLADAD